MTAVVDAPANLQTALTHANALLAVKPHLALEQAEEILRVLPDQANALLIKSLAYSHLGAYDSAVQTLLHTCKRHPNWAIASMELGLLYGKAGQLQRAVGALQRALALQIDLPKAWLALAGYYADMGDIRSADRAYVKQVQYSSTNAKLLSAASSLVENNIADAERTLKDYLNAFPTDVAAIRMLAEVAARLGRDSDAEHLLSRCLELAPSFHFARQNYAYILNRNNKFELALEQANILLTQDTKNLSYKNLKAVCYSKIGDYQEAIKLYKSVLHDNPGYSKIWHSYGHTLKTAGQLQEAIAAYRKAIVLEPNFGEAYWSLANLKTFRFSEADRSKIQTQLNAPEISSEDRFHFDFALAKALEDQKEFALAFAHYEKANALRKRLIHYKPERNKEKVRISKQLFDTEFFAQRKDFGCTSTDPIFILGMPRAGSTLIEQILSSHSQVEGTMELPDIISISKDLFRTLRTANAKTYYPALLELSADQAYNYGQNYLKNTQIHRKSGRPFFIDKMPNNFAHLGLIHLILPNAKIIDARRNPMACCFSNYKQHFARGQSFSYSLDDMGNYYRDYVELMAHYAAVLPGKVHRVHYENMVSDTENEVRKLLAYCGLEFESACLNFYENDRPVRTASSEQVRQPIYTSGVDQWRHFEPWLEPLKTVLGPVVALYPEVPEFT